MWRQRRRPSGREHRKPRDNNLKGGVSSVSRARECNGAAASLGEAAAERDDTHRQSDRHGVPGASMAAEIAELSGALKRLLCGMACDDPSAAREKPEAARVLKSRNGAGLIIISAA